MPRPFNGHKGTFSSLVVIKVVFTNFLLGCFSFCSQYYSQAFFVVSLCLFLTSSALLLSDYKQKDSLALRQTVGSAKLYFSDSVTCISLIL